MVVDMKILYDDIACHYDQVVNQDIENNSFPYAGYQMIQDIFSDELMRKKNKLKILDIGCGTCKLYDQINPKKMDLTGVDESRKMLEIAKKRYPESHFIHHDIIKGMPEALRDESYDIIVVNYLFMHFSFKTSLDLIHTLLKHLKHEGKIIVGDLLFINSQVRQDFFYEHQDYVGLGLYFHLYSMFVNKMSEQLALSFFEVNDYTGLMIIENINDIPLLFEDPLVKYKSNTEKWRSTHPRKKRE